MTDQLPSNVCPGYEVVLTLREIDGTLRFRCARAVTWIADAEATRDDARWDQREKHIALGQTTVEVAAELVAWARGVEL